MVTVFFLPVWNALSYGFKSLVKLRGTQCNRVPAALDPDMQIRREWEAAATAPLCGSHANDALDPRPEPGPLRDSQPP